VSRDALLFGTRVRLLGYFTRVIITVWRPWIHKLGGVKSSGREYGSDILLQRRIMANKFNVLRLIFGLGEVRVSMTHAKRGASEKLYEPLILTKQQN